MKTEAPTPLTESAERVARVAERCELTSDTSYCDSTTGEEVIDSPLQLAADLRSLLAERAALAEERDRLAGECTELRKLCGEAAAALKGSRLQQILRSALNPTQSEKSDG